MSSTKANLGWSLTALLRDYLKQVDAALADLPSGSRGFMMLTAIADANCHSQVALAERLGLDRTTVTYLLDGLERDDLVRRRPDPADRRVRHIILTETGVGRLAELTDAVDRIEAQVLSRLAGDEADHFRHLLLKAAGLAPDTATMCQQTIETGVLIEGR